MQDDKQAQLKDKERHSAFATTVSFLVAIAGMVPALVHDWRSSKTWVEYFSFKSPARYLKSTTSMVGLAVSAIAAGYGLKKYGEMIAYRDALGENEPFKGKIVPPETLSQSGTKWQDQLTHSQSAEIQR